MTFELSTPIKIVALAGLLVARPRRARSRATRLLRGMAAHRDRRARRPDARRPPTRPP